MLHHFSPALGQFWRLNALVLGLFRRLVLNGARLPGARLPGARLFALIRSRPLPPLPFGRTLWPSGALVLACSGPQPLRLLASSVLDRLRSQPL